MRSSASRLPSSPLRLAGGLATRWRASGRAELPRSGRRLAAYALGAAALAWGAAAGWDDGAFRVYYLFGGLQTAALLGAGSLVAPAAGRRAARARLRGARGGRRGGRPRPRTVGGTRSRTRRTTSRLFPARLLAVLGNGLVARARSGRRRPASAAGRSATR